MLSNVDSSYRQTLSSFLKFLHIGFCFLGDKLLGNWWDLQVSLWLQCVIPEVRLVLRSDPSTAWKWEEMYVDLRLIFDKRILGLVLVSLSIERPIRSRKHSEPGSHLGRDGPTHRQMKLPCKKQRRHLQKNAGEEPKLYIIRSSLR